MASFFSPCSFPLLVTLLARETGAERGEERSVLPRTLRFATALSIGAALFLLLAGAAIALGGAPLFEGVTFTSAAGRTIRIIIGSLLILFGLMQIGVIPVPFEAVAELAFPLERRQAQLRRRHPTAGFALFGFAYILAGFG